MARPGQQKNRRKRALAEMEAASSASTPTTYYAESSTAATNLPDQSTPYDVGPGYGEEEDNDDDEDGGQSMDNPRSQCLPVGILPIDFDGTPIDGSQFLAMANRDNQNLPFVKSVDNPYQTEIPSNSKHLGLNMTDNNGASSSGSSTRHPALPKESWQVLFPIHFQGYRKHFQSQLSSSSNPLTYPDNYPPMPNLNRRSEWYAFINGYILDDKPKTKSKKGKEKEKAKPVLTEEEMMNATMGEDMGLDEEEEESKDAEVVEKVIIGKTSNGNEKRIGPAREPLLSALKGMTSSQALKILSHFAHWISESIEQFPPPIIPHSPDLLPTQPGYDPSTSSPGKRREKEVRSINPLSSNYFNWIFSLLLFIDERLLGEEISILRELARASMRVAGHRWIWGVVGKDIDENWILGGGWKIKRNEKEYQNQIGPQIPTLDTAQQDGLTTTNEIEGKAKVDNDNTVDDILARCWLIVHAVSAGWGQKDLLMELETLFT